jgi:glycosyltransferase 2 family protein
MKPGWSLRNIAWWVLSFVVSGVLLYYSLRGVDWTAVWHTIAAAKWWYLVGGAAITSGSYFLRGLRWRVLLNAEADFPVGTVFWANMAGYLGNNFLPARAGEVLRSVLISSRSKLSRTYVLTTALSERLMDVIALVLGASLVLLTVSPKPRWMEDLSRTMAIVAGLGAVAIMVAPHTGTLVERILLRIPMPAGLRKTLLHLTEQILLGMRAFHDWRRFATFVFLTLVIWAADSAGAIVGARALGLHFSFGVALLLLTGMGLGSALPSTPGYVGVYQFVAVTILMPFGVSRDAALAYILVVQVSGYIIVALFGLPGLYISRGTTPLRVGAAGSL